MLHLLEVPELSRTAPAVHIQRQHHSSTFRTYACVIDAKSPMAKRSPKAKLSSRLPVTVTPNIKGKASGYRKRLNSQAVHITYVQIYQLYAKHRSTYYSFYCHKKALYEERGKEGCGYRVAPVGKPGAWDRLWKKSRYHRITGEEEGGKNAEGKLCVTWCLKQVGIHQARNAFGTVLEIKDRVVIGNWRSWSFWWRPESQGKIVLAWDD